MKKVKLGFLLLAIICLMIPSCAEVTYRADNAFMNSAQAGAFEYPILVNGKLCRDLDQEVGLCSMRLPDSMSLEITVRAQPYPYRYQLTCSRELDADQAMDVPKNQDAFISVAPSHYGNLRSFTCIVEIFPKDRPSEISAQAEVRLKLFDHSYVEREEMGILERDGKSYLYLGDHAKYAKVCIGAVCKRYQETTVLEVPKGPTIFAYSESERMRFNYFSSR